jgi:hypothetical protein
MINPFNKRIDIRFSLSTLLLFMVAFCGPLAWWVQEAKWYRHEQAALGRLRREDPTIEFEYCGSFNSEQGIWGLAVHTLRCWFGFKNIGSLRIGPIDGSGLPSRDLIAFRRLHSLWIGGIRRDTDFSSLSQFVHLQRLGISGDYPDHVSSFEAIHTLDTITLHVGFPADQPLDYLANLSECHNLRLINYRYPYHGDLISRLKERRPDCHINSFHFSSIASAPRVFDTRSGCRVEP